MPSQAIKFNKSAMIALALVMVLELVGLVAFYMHQDKSVKSLHQEYTTKEAEVAHNRSMGNQLPVVEAKLQTDQEQLGHLENALSTKDYVPTLLIQLQKLAADTHNQIISVKPIPAPPPPPVQTNTPAGGVNTPAGGTNAANGGPAAPAAPDAASVAYDKYQVELSLQGPYRNVMDFLMKLTTFPKIVGVEKFQVTAQAAKPGESGMVTANLTFTAYILKEAKS